MLKNEVILSAIAVVEMEEASEEEDEVLGRILTKFDLGTAGLSDLYGEGRVDRSFCILGPDCRVDEDRRIPFSSDTLRISCSRDRRLSGGF